MKKPNVVFILADQLSYLYCGYAGDKQAITPNIDNLAKESANFTQAVVSMPVCSAFRASLFTGKYTTSTGMVINELRLNPEHHPHCLAHQLANGGYETAYIGKWHLWANELGNHYDRKNSFVPPGPYRLGFDGLFAHYNFHHQYYGDIAYYHLETPGKIYFDEGYEPDNQTDMAIEVIKNKRNDEKPFALFLSVGTPHDPWTEKNVPPEYYSKFKDTEFELPPNYDDKLDPYGDDWSNETRTPEKINEWKKAYYAMTANLDMNIGRLQDAILESGLEDNTIFVFTSDHGECFGAQGRMKKNIFYEEAARVPMLIKYPEKVNPKELDSCFNCVDIMPTLLGLTDCEIPQEVEGMDLSHLLRGEEGPEPEFSFMQNTGACAAWEDGHEWRALRNKQYTFALFRGCPEKNLPGKELLFDNSNDPYQIANLADNSEYEELKNSLRKKLFKKMADLNDDFPESTWYKDHWVSDDRCILRTAVNI